LGIGLVTDSFIRPFSSGAFLCWWTFVMADQHPLHLAYQRSMTHTLLHFYLLLSWSVTQRLTLLVWNILCPGQLLSTAAPKELITLSRVRILLAFYLFTADKSLVLFHAHELYHGLCELQQVFSVLQCQLMHKHIIVA